MPRRRRRRRVSSRPDFTYFGPGRGGSTSEIVLKVEEFEAIRLADYEGLSQEAAAEEMGVSQPTFHRTLVSARKKIAEALTTGKALRVEGGDYEFVNKGDSQGKGRGRGRGRGGPPK